MDENSIIWFSPQSNRFYMMFSHLNPFSFNKKKENRSQMQE